METRHDKATLQEAMEEAYASVAADNPIPLHAMEIDHPAFSGPLRVIRWPVAGPEPERFLCLHEEKASLDPGARVEYVGFPFEITLPESSANTEGTFRFKVAIYNEFDQYLMAAAMSPGVITATYRQFVKGRELEGPEAVWPGITISNPRREGTDIIADGMILGWMKKPYGGLYLSIDYPGLVSGR
jgi:hypothetical protein